MAPWVSREIKKERPTGAKANITREDDNNDNMNFIGLLDEKITGLEKKCHYYEMASSLYEAVYIISNTAVFGTLIYILFKIF